MPARVFSDSELAALKARGVKRVYTDMRALKAAKSDLKDWRDGLAILEAEKRAGTPIKDSVIAHHKAMIAKAKADIEAAKYHKIV